MACEGDGEKGYCLLDYNKSIIFVCNPAVYEGDVNFYMSFMLTGYPKNGRRARLFSFYNKDSWTNLIRR